MAPLVVAAVAGGIVALLRRSSTRVPAARLSDASLMGLKADTGYLPSVRDLANAIAFAEGFGVAGSIPTRAHNPGDLVLPGWTGGSLGAERVSVFPTDTEGWARLYHQINLVVTGQSRVYSLEMTLAEFAAKWTATEQRAWTQNVVRSLVAAGHHVTAETTLDEVLQ